MSHPDWWFREVMNLPDLSELPAKAWLGDICKHQGVYWVYYDRWITIEEANKRMEKAE